jgi:hypothetical protein
MGIGRLLLHDVAGVGRWMVRDAAGVGRGPNDWLRVLVERPAL